MKERYLDCSHALDYYYQPHLPEDARGCLDLSYASLLSAANNKSAHQRKGRLIVTR